MRTLIITGIFPPDVGGPATYVPAIATWLASRGHSVTVLTLADQPYEERDGAWIFAVVRLARRRAKPWRWLQTIIAIVRAGRHADVLFVNGLALEAVCANFLLRKPLVQKVVGDLAWELATNRCWTDEEFEEFQSRRHGWKIELLAMLRTTWTRRARLVITPSRFLAGVVARWGVPKSAIRVIYNGVDVFPETTNAAPPLGIPLKIVTVCRLVAWKRVDEILRAIAQLPDVGAVVIGEGPEGARLEDLARELGIANRVWFAGRCSGARTRSLMRACDIFVLHSTYEGLPHAAIEAMIVGLPVIATAVGGTPEVVEDGRNGFLIEPTLEALIDRLRRLVGDPALRAAMGRAAAESAARRFSAHEMNVLTEQALVELARCSEP